MDIPAANVVIRFDPMVHSVSMVQGRGRARQADSHFVVMSERPDRTVRQLEEIEQLQNNLVRSFGDAKLAAGCDGSIDQKLVAAQVSRERGARDILLRSQTASAVEAVSLLHQYGSKTKASVDENFFKDQHPSELQGASGGAVAMWRCSLSYSSPLRSVQVSAAAVDKKQAKRLASAALLKDLAAAAAAV